METEEAVLTRTQAHGQSHGQSHYVKVWAILTALLIVSVCGPIVGIRSVTLLMAFGVAVVKAVMVAAEFMHLKVEKKYISYLLLTMLLLMTIFFYGVAPDVMKGGGQNWLRLPIEEAPTQGEVHN